MQGVMHMIMGHDHGHKVSGGGGGGGDVIGDDGDVDLL